MPTYEYICKSCKHAHEEFQTMSAKPLRKCPACGRNTLERQIGTGAGVIFKGGGFYQTDYRSDSYKKSAEADKKPASSDNQGSANSGACACGRKPAGECASKSAADSTPAKSDSKPAKVESTESKKKSPNKSVS